MKSQLFIFLAIIIFSVSCKTTFVWKKTSEPYKSVAECEVQKKSETNWLRIGLFCHSNEQEGDRSEPKFKYPTGKLRCHDLVLELECGDSPEGISKEMKELQNPSKEDLDGLKTFDDPFFKN